MLKKIFFFKIILKFHRYVDYDVFGHLFRSFQHYLLDQTWKHGLRSIHKSAKTKIEKSCKLCYGNVFRKGILLMIFLSKMPSFVTVWTFYIVGWKITQNFWKRPIISIHRILSDPKIKITFHNIFLNPYRI